MGQHGTHLVVAMPYLQKQLINGQIVASPYLGGNPTLQAKISQISGTCSCANQRYDSLQTSLRKRFSMGLEYQLSYTFSKGMSDSIGYYGEGGQAGATVCLHAEPVRPQEPSGVPLYFDIQACTSPGSFVYQLPLGQKKKFGSTLEQGGGWRAGRLADWAAS